MDLPSMHPVAILTRAQTGLWQEYKTHQHSEEEKPYQVGLSSCRRRHARCWCSVLHRRDQAWICRGRKVRSGAHNTCCVHKRVCGHFVQRASANWPHSYRTTLTQQTDDSDASAANLKACHKRCAERTFKVLEKNGSIFIKFGQHLSSMGYLLPYEWTTTFVPLQDKCPVSSYESIEEMFLKDTGHRIDEDFDDFSREPIGAASLAQVHTAVLKNTQRKVAVKVQHPTLAEWVPLDLALTRFTFGTLKRVFPEYDLSWLSNEMEFSPPKELDFPLEGSNALFARDYFRKNTNFPLITPDVISSSRRILVMDY